MKSKILQLILITLITLASFRFIQSPVLASPNDPLATTVGVNGTVYAIEVTATKIYIGGDFTEVGGEARNSIAALNLDGTLDTSWNPNIPTLEIARVVSSIYATDTAIYVGGNFLAVNGVTARGNAAAFEIANGSNTGTALAWNPDSDAGIYKVIGNGTKIYLGGVFSTVGGVERYNLAAVDSTTGALDASWNPKMNGSVYDMLIQDSKLYAVGLFQLANDGQATSATRNFGANFNLANGSDVGAVQTWNPNLDNVVNAIEYYNSKLYLGGAFNQVGADFIDFAARVNTTDGTLDASWNPDPDGTVYDLAISDEGNIFLGGAFDSIGVDAHKWVGLVNSSTGAVSVWDPVLTIGFIDTVYALDISDATVSVGGDFNRVNGSDTHANFAQFRFPKISFSTTTSSADEDDGTVSIVVSQDIASDIDLAFDVSVDEDSTASAGSRFVAGDYAFADAGPHTILSGELTFNLDIEITDDETDESNETLIIDLISSDIIFLGTNTTHTLTIVDNEVFAGDITIVPTSISATEGGAAATYEATITPDAPSGETVTLTPTPNAQVTISPSSVTFSHIDGCGVCPVVLSQVFTVTAVDDATVEGAHTGTITHTVTGDNADYNALVPSSVTVNITDNDTAPVASGGGGGAFGSPAYFLPDVVKPPVPQPEIGFHPVGTNIKDQAGTVYVITNGPANSLMRRPYTSAASFLSYGFNSFETVINANDKDLTLAIGPFVRPQEGRVICSDRLPDKGTCYVISQGKKVGIVSMSVLTELGYLLENVLYGDISFLTATEQPLASSAQAHLPGMLIKNGQTIQLVIPGGLSGFPTLESFNSWGFSFSAVVNANSFDLQYMQTSLVPLRIPGQFMY